MRENDRVMVRVLSLGAGVQSTTMALMAAAGEIGPMPDCAIFADTGWEPQAVYSHLEWLRGELPFPVHVVSIGNLKRDILDGLSLSGQRFSSIPFYTIDERGKRGMGARQCTRDYKIIPIRRKVRELLGGKAPKGGCEMWIGISTDEVSRMKPSVRQYIVHRWPLIEAGISRSACLQWMGQHGYPRPPRSACLGCPYHNNDEWRAIKNGDPAEWAETIEIDRAIRVAPRLRAQQFMHRSLVPLDQVDLSTAEERGQLSMFNDECEGMCGV